MSIYDKQKAEYIEKYYNEVGDLERYPHEIREYALSVIKGAASTALDAGYSGSWTDGGAGRMIESLKEFLHGFKCGRWHEPI